MHFTVLKYCTIGRYTVKSQKCAGSVDKAVHMYSNLI